MVDLLFGDGSPFAGLAQGPKFKAALIDAEIISSDDEADRRERADRGVIEMIDDAEWEIYFAGRDITPLSIETFKFALKYCMGKLENLTTRSSLAADKPKGVERAAADVVVVEVEARRAEAEHARRRRRAEAARAEAAAQKKGGTRSMKLFGSGKKSRKLRKRTIGGKKSRKLRKRTTLKGGKRKRRRTRCRR